MAESESGQDKTEEPTEKRRREAREKGQLPRSRELNTLAILMAGAGGLLMYGADLAGALLRLMRSNFELSRETAMNTESMLQLLGASAYLAAQGLWPILLMLLLIAAVDVPYQIWDNRQKLLMTKQEVRDEYKDSEGKPEVKSKIRQMQREMAQRRMMAAVPEADVVITNPTHFAVALKYDPAGGGAPLLLAKGNDFLALKIREVAQEHKVMVMESPALARAVYYSTELDQEIPAGLYLAVAQVLAYVYQLKQYQAGKGKRPSPLKDLPIPPDLRRDE
ncbi:flagellar type III secretion system protein FlhB [Pseudomonas aeruginosa]|uniref:flagellar type III secretion system protein FlhB n=1 Tax=Pseudomonas aeruginosa TaxID=287 RepID=UPI002F91061A